MKRSVFANYVRSKISFELVHSQVGCIRECRSKALRHEGDGGGQQCDGDQGIECVDVVELWMEDI